MSNFEVLPQKEGIFLFTDDDFDLLKIFDCGQCFRWNPTQDGGFSGIVKDRFLRLRKKDGGVVFECTEKDFYEIWLQYFDLDLNYSDIRKTVSINDYMLSASDFGKGIRILKQDPWEALCSFIVSQCNNIPRIKSIISRLCSLCGEQKSFEDTVYFTFPSAERLSMLLPNELAPLRCGYRAKYIIDAANAVSSGKLDLTHLSALSPDTAIKSLMEFNGVGKKVASCTALFGLHLLDAFPIDTWMKKAVEKHFPQGLNPAVFGGYAGIAQQYMFYYERSGDLDKEITAD